MKKKANLYSKHDVVEPYKGWDIVQWDGRGRWFAYNQEDRRELFDCGFGDIASAKETIDETA